MMLKMPSMLLNTTLLVRELLPICIKVEPKRNLMMPRRTESPQLEWLKFFKLEKMLMKPKNLPDNLLLSKHTKLMSFMLKNTTLTSKPEPLLKLLLITPHGNLCMELKRDFH
jgi:hypothetical protein